MAGLLAVPQDQVKLEMSSSGDVDVAVTAVGQTFVVELTEAASAGPVAIHAERAAGAAKALRKRAIPVVAVPYMGPSGKDASERAGVSWLDFSGNAHIVAPGIRIMVDGRPNQFPKRGRPSSAFAPKSSRIARWLLMHPAEAMAQREISQATGVSEGLVSRVVARLEEEHHVVREDGRQIRAASPQLLLEAWQDEYRESRVPRRCPRRESVVGGSQRRRRLPGRRGTRRRSLCPPPCRSTWTSRSIPSERQTPPSGSAPSF